MSITKDGVDIVFTDQWFGPFSDLADAEQCVLNLAGRPNVVSAEVINKKYVSVGPGVRCVHGDCPGTLFDDGLGVLKCEHCNRVFYITEAK